MSKNHSEHKPKSSSAEVETRINKVFDLLIAGASRSQVIQFASDKAKWDVTDRQIDTYIAEANKRLIEVGKTHRETELGRAIARLNNLYFLSITVQNFNVALGVQKEINKLLGLTLEESLVQRIAALEEVTKAK
jgi:hypothetical protein